MNYFGHAALASEHRAEAAFVLGAMLPDLAGMLQTRCPTAEDSALQAGLAFHHATDAVFHGCSTFLSLNLAASTDLRRAGVGRGAARAVAHVCTEMLLDSLLIERADYERNYLHALASARAATNALLWSRSGDRENFVELAAHLYERGAAVHSSAPERIVFRLSRTLGGRRRLEPSPVELEAIHSWIPTHGLRVCRRAEELLLQVRSGLSLGPPPHLG